MDMDTSRVVADPCSLTCGDQDFFVVLHRPKPDRARGPKNPDVSALRMEGGLRLRGMRSWANTLADAGYPAARITLPSTGDSFGSPHDADRLRAWIDAVTVAANWLRGSTGCSRTVAIGIELGGLLASWSQAGARRSTIWCCGTCRRAAGRSCGRCSAWPASSLTGHRTTPPMPAPAR